MRVPNTGKTPRVEKLRAELAAIMGEPPVVAIRRAGPPTAAEREVIERMERAAAQYGDGTRSPRRDR